MKTFKDTLDREWTIDLNVAALRRVVDLVKVDLLAVLDQQSDVWSRLLADPALFAGVLYAVCCRGDPKPPSQADFERGLAGDALTAALVAFEEDLISFFPLHLRPQAVEALLATNRRAMEAIRKSLEALPPAPPSQSPATDGDGSTNLPASSESTPAP